jgi:replicative DNA helicase
MIEELDLKILKGILADKVQANTFAYRYDHTLFDESAERFAKLVLDYIKTFRAPPTKRTLLDRHQNNAHLIELIEKVFGELDTVEYDQIEYAYDLAALKRRYQEMAVEAIRERAGVDDPDAPEDPQAYFNAIQLEIARVTSLDLERSHTQKPVGDYIDEFAESYEARKLAPEETPEIRTGYSMIDVVCGGLSPGELVMIGGETNSGKSMMLNNMAKQLWMQENTLDTAPENVSRGYNVLYFSLEMPYQDCFIRFLASLANVPQRSLSKSLLTPEEEERVKKAYDFIKMYQENGYYFDIVDVPRNLTIEEVELRYHDAMLRYRPDVVVVDYMGLMHSTAMAKEQDWLKMGALAASLHEFARAYDCVVITAAQLTDLKRNASGSQEEGRRIGVHRWGRSSLIMHNVNLGIQIETRPNERSFPDLKIHVVKNRKGPLGQGSLIKNFANASLVDVPYDQNEMPGDVTANIPNLIKSIQEAKNKAREEAQ